jgi:hypothetical protein
MKTALLGYSGFVGQNLSKSYQFDDMFNSKNISTIKNKSYDMVFCSAIPANMQIANANPEEDFQQISNLLETLKATKIKKLVMISTIAVYGDNINNVDEDTLINKELLTPYGKHRLVAEELANQLFNCTIIRLPSLFGIGLKKNLIYDLKNLAPSFIKPLTFEELLSKISTAQAKILHKFYTYNPVSKMMSFNKLMAVDENALADITNIFEELNFTSLNFTNSNSLFQFYNLANLYNDCMIAVNNKINILNICSESVLAKDVVKYLTNKDFNNLIAKQYLYNMTTKYGSLWGKTKYQYDKFEILEQLKDFYKNEAI